MVDKWNSEYAGNKQSVNIAEMLKIVGATSAKKYKDTNGATIVDVGEVITNDMYDKFVKLRMGNVDIIPGKVEYEPMAFGVTINPLRGSDNWFSQMGFQDIKEPLSAGAMYGKTDLLDEPRSRQMVGKTINIGEGYNKWHDEFKKMKKNMNNTIADLFD